MQLAGSGIEHGCQNVLKNANRIFFSGSGWPTIRSHNRFCCFCAEFVNLLHVHRYSVDIFSYSGPSGILDSEGKQDMA